MAAWSRSFEGGPQCPTADPARPSLASIMLEQEEEEKRRKTSQQNTGISGNRAGPRIQGKWASNPAPPLKPDSLTKIMDEQRFTPTSSRDSYVFKSYHTDVKLKPYSKTKTTPTYTDQHNSSMASSGTRTTVVNVRKQSLRGLGYKDLVDWLKDPSHVYIGRNMTHYVPGAVGSKWGNPFKMAKGTFREDCCEKYKNYIENDTKIQSNGQTLLQSLNELKGKTLGCWCHPELCHGHILVQLIEKYCG